MIVSLCVSALRIYWFSRTLQCCLHKIATDKVGLSKCLPHKKKSQALECAVGQWPSTQVLIASENPGLVCTLYSVHCTYISRCMLSPSAHCGIEWCLCQFLAVHVSKKRGIRGESGDREGTSANCLLLLLPQPTGDTTG